VSLLDVARVLRFEAGGLRLGVSIADLNRVLVEEDLTAVPFGHDALAGVVVVEPFGVVPIFDLLGLAGDATRAKARPSRPGAAVLLLPTAKGPIGLRIDRLAGTLSAYGVVTTAEAAQFLETVPRPLMPVLAGVARDQGEVFWLFSPEAFVASLGI
jgi:chemotaxis signal transduction protein